MSDEKTKLEVRQQWDETADKVDRVASAAVDVFRQEGSFKQALALARAVRDMRELLTDEIMAPVMDLMNTSLGFRTDKDPNQLDWKNGNKPFIPYPVAVVREVFIEAKLRGFHPIGNEFNIISGQFYGTQNGFNRKVRELTKGTYEDSIDVPVIGGTQATVTCRATWRIGDKEGSIGVKKDDPCSFLVRVNEKMLPDAIAGKAKRKLLKRVFERLTGQVVSDDEATDIIEVKSTVSSGTKGEALKAPKEPDFGLQPLKAEPAVTESSVSSPAAAKQSEATAAVQADLLQPQESVASPTTPSNSSSEELQPFQELFLEKMKELGCELGKVLAWLESTKKLPDATSKSTWGEIPELMCKLLLRDKKAMTEIVNNCK